MNFNPDFLPDPEKPVSREKASALFAAMKEALEKDLPVDTRIPPATPRDSLSIDIKVPSRPVGGWLNKYEEQEEEKAEKRQKNNSSTE